MANVTIREIMVPLSEYATVREGATLLDAVLALEKAQEEFEHYQYRHRAVLVLNGEGRVVGKLSQLDVLSALEPGDSSDAELKQLMRLGFSHEFIRGFRKQKRLEAEPLKNLCGKAAGLKVEAFMQAPGEGEYVEATASLDIAVHQLVAGDHLSLLVTQGDAIVGVLRLADVFAAVFHLMKECQLT
ncbi:MAG: CBS domain-containing protein [Desulfobacterales bacterium]|nr:CBS domain-containing protein [Desulfobacteraceae bacterium]MDD3990762.1 CBS domain-containing protein [Desulfobacteraceae bacterium]MDY0310547.1 CBS domain-containing protein [Desulfobacterales bacterium]